MRKEETMQQALWADMASWNAAHLLLLLGGLGSLHPHRPARRPVLLSHPPPSRLLSVEDVQRRFAIHRHVKALADLECLILSGILGGVVACADELLGLDLGEVEPAAAARAGGARQRACHRA